MSMMLSDVWMDFVFAYAIIALGTILIQYSILFIGSNKKYPMYHKKVSIVIPCYNEKKESLIGCIESCIHQDYPHCDIWLVDDGSIISIKEFVAPYKKQIHFYSLSKNMGKRAAQSYAILRTDAEIIVTVDSDTILDKSAVTEMVRYFTDPKVGSVAGNVKILNEGDNLLTKMLSARCFNASLIERQTQGYANALVCNGGALSAYRKSIILKHIADYNSQTFLGNKCHYGDDRRLTAYVHMENMKTRFCKQALAWTEVPNTFRGFIKMMIRWKKSFFRENFLAMGYMWKNPSLTFENLRGLIMPFASLFLRANLIILCFINPFYILWYIGMVFYMAMMRTIIILTEDKHLAGYNILYAYFHESCVYWVTFYAIITLKDNSWGTR